MTFKKNRNLLTKIIISLAIALGSSGLAIAEEPNTSAAKIAVVPYETLSIGNQSGCKKRALFAISDAGEWQRVWGIHTSGLTEAPSIPKVDFSRQSVLAILSGERSDGKFLQIAQIVRSPQETVVYFSTGAEESWLNVSQMPKADELAQPYAFLVIDKPATPLRFVDAFAEQNNCSKCVVK